MFRNTYNVDISVSIYIYLLFAIYYSATISGSIPSIYSYWKHICNRLYWSLPNIFTLDNWRWNRYWGQRLYLAFRAQYYIVSSAKNNNDNDANNNNNELEDDFEEDLEDVDENVDDELNYADDE